jgi:carbamoyl-phosphate synthase small subunit
MGVREGALVLADASVFEGELIGAEPPDGIAAGEVVFNTVMTGYQEVISDPSYAGQIITFTTSHLGNYGTNDTDMEAVRPYCRGVVVRDLARRASNQRCEADLDTFLRRHGIAGIAGVDTRRLTRLVRDTGAMPGAFGSADVAALTAAATAEPGTDGVDLVSQVTTATPYTPSGAFGNRGGGARLDDGG